MNLIEAMKSGRKYARPHWPRYACGVEAVGVGVGGQSVAVGLLRDDGRTFPLDPEDITAEDYILEPEPKLLTREEVRTAYDEAYRTYLTGKDLHLNQMLDLLFGEEE